MTSVDYPSRRKGFIYLARRLNTFLDDLLRCGFQLFQYSAVFSLKRLIYALLSWILKLIYYPTDEKLNLRYELWCNCCKHYSTKSWYLVFVSFVCVLSFFVLFLLSFLSITHFVFQKYLNPCRLRL